MANGRHAATEVPAAYTIEDCWKLVDTSEKTRRHCIMIENCCYGENETLVLGMIRAGVFGALLYGEAAYIHDLREELFSNKGEGLWRRTVHTERDGGFAGARRAHERDERERPRLAGVAGDRDDVEHAADDHLPVAALAHPATHEEPVDLDRTVSVEPTVQAGRDVPELQAAVSYHAPRMRVLLKNAGRCSSCSCAAAPLPTRTGAEWR